MKQTKSTTQSMIYIKKYRKEFCLAAAANNNFFFAKYVVKK